MVAKVMKSEELRHVGPRPQIVGGKTKLMSTTCPKTQNVASVLRVIMVDSGKRVLAHFAVTFLKRFFLILLSHRRANTLILAKLA